MQAQVLERCQQAFPSWRSLRLDEVAFAAPKGFSSLTMAVKPRPTVDPPAAFYRHLEGKENAILDFEAERRVFETLGEHGVAARCYAYERGYRIEAHYEGRTLNRFDLKDPAVLEAIAEQLSRLHRVRVEGLPRRGFFDLLPEVWAPLARRVLIDQRHVFPEDERRMCDELLAILSGDTRERVRACLPDGPLSFCHNDTYHGNIMRLEGGAIRLLDFEFSCLNHPAYDVSNLFAETVMRHKLPEAPHFAIAEPEYGTDDIVTLIEAYLDQAGTSSARPGRAERERLLGEVMRLLPLSDYKYAMAAIPLAVAPIQTIRFIPYAHARFRRFQGAVRATNPGTS